MKTYIVTDNRQIFLDLKFNFTPVLTGQCVCEISHDHDSYEVSCDDFDVIFKYANRGNFDGKVIFVSRNNSEHHIENRDVEMFELTNNEVLSSYFPLFCNIIMRS